MNVVNKIILLTLISTSTLASECVSFVVSDRIEVQAKVGISTVKVKNYKMNFDCWKEGKSLRCAGDDDGGLFYIYKDKVEFHYLNLDEGTYQNIPKKPVEVKREACK